MSATKEIKEVRCNDALSVLCKDGQAVFFTLTTPDVVEYDEIRDRWRRLRHELLRTLRRSGKTPQYVMNYERHNPYLLKVVDKNTPEEHVVHGDGKSHGWHIHGVISCFIPLHQFRYLLDICGFGRVDVRRVTSKGVSDYLTKHALKAYRGLSSRDKDKYRDGRFRLVNASRGLPSLDSYSYRSDFIKSRSALVDQAKEIPREVKSYYNPFADTRRDYRKITCYAEIAVLLKLNSLYKTRETIEKIIKFGRYPAGVDGQTAPMMGESGQLPYLRDSSHEGV